MKLITGNVAVKLAEIKNVARPGTFSAAAIKWEDQSEKHAPLIIEGIIECNYCGKITQFSIEGLTSKVNCSGCSSTFSLFNSEYKIEGKDTQILVASIFSHPVELGIKLPHIEIKNLRSENNSTYNENDISEVLPKPSLLDVWDCGDRVKIKKFIDNGGDINARDTDQFTLLHRAASEDLLEYVKNLLDFGADPNLPVLPGRSKTTLEVVRNNHYPNSSKIEKILIDKISSGGQRTTDSNFKSKIVNQTSDYKTLNEEKKKNDPYQFYKESRKLINNKAEEDQKEHLKVLARKAEEERIKEIKSKRLRDGKCINCGKPLGFFNRLFKHSTHNNCVSFKD